MQNSGKSADPLNTLVSTLTLAGSLGKLLADNVGFAPGVIASDTLLHSSDALTQEPGNAYVKTKEILILVTGTYRVKFDLKSPDNAAHVAKGRIYKDAAAFGTEKSEVGVTYVTQSEDLAFNAGELLQLYQKNTSAGHDSDVINLRLYGTLTGVVGGDNIV